jgi:uncharacterized protein
VQVGILLIAFPFPLQFLASVVSFPAGDSGSGAAFGVLSGSWLAAGLIFITSPPHSTSGALGMLFLTAGCALALLVVPTMAQGKRAPAIVLALAAFRFLTTGIHELAAVKFWADLSAIDGLLLAAAAAYAATATELGGLRPSASARPGTPGRPAGS